jgi:hypothetical protein
MTHNHSSQSVGGSYSDLRKLYKGTGQTKEIHHIPAHSAYKDITPMSRGGGSSIVMDKEDHQKTASYGKGKAARAYCNEQKKLIAAGKFDAAFEMDKADLRAKFGSKYDRAISQAESHLHQKVIPHLKSSPTSKIPDKLQDIKQNSSKSDRKPANSIDQKLGHLKVDLPQTQNPHSSSKPSRNPSPNR